MVVDYTGITLPVAKRIQEQFREQLKFDSMDESSISTIAGADISFNKNSHELYATIIILDYPSLKLKAYALAKGESDFPYFPGYLGFREVPTLLKAWSLLPYRPDVTILDGQGILHPRRMGIASHFGILTGQPTVGCAKTSLYGYYEQPNALKYAASPVYEKHTNAHIGYALRTKNATKPIYVSPGYGMSLENSLAILKKCAGKYRIPEPTRIAHEIVNQYRIGKLAEGYHQFVSQQELF
ncbi:MAG: endonuclease V [Pedobacter sp.]|nr:endonuclease V [Pedobacter sp.]MDQ8052009.1 endonuclease V [Pedobacter sp.]